MSKRCEVERYKDLMNVIANRPLKITHIMYQTNINSGVVKIMIDKLNDAKLLKAFEIKNQTFYSLTPAGLEVLKQVNAVFKLMEDIINEQKNDTHQPNV